MRDKSILQLSGVRASTYVTKSSVFGQGFPAAVTPSTITDSVWDALSYGYAKIGVSADNTGVLFVRYSRTNSRTDFPSVLLKRYLPGMLLGRSNSQLARDEGSSEATISRRMATILRQTGLLRSQLVVCARVFPLVKVPPLESCDFKMLAHGPQTWSPTEELVARLSVAGMSIIEIATLRHRNATTTHKQLRSAARKASCEDRWELASSLQLSVELMSEPRDPRTGLRVVTATDHLHRGGNSSLTKSASDVMPRGVVLLSNHRPKCQNTGYPIEKCRRRLVV